jgi:hypothetical protein
MSKPSIASTRLQLESLETRTLLAGDVSAITSSGSFVTNFDPATTPSSIAIAGNNGGDLTVDASLLPDSVSELKISGFSSVTVKGTDKFVNLQLSDIESFSGENIDVVGTLKVTNVGTLQLHALAGMAWLYGDQMKLDVYDAASMTILSELDVLMISSHTNLLSLLGKPETGDQSVELGLVFDASQLGDIGAFTKIVFAKDLEPSPDPGTNEPGNGDQTEKPNQFVVVIVSKSSLTAAKSSLLRLQDALQAGDTASIRAAFAEFLNEVEAADQGTKPSVFLTSGSQSETLRAAISSGLPDDLTDLPQPHGGEQVIKRTISLEQLNRMVSLQTSARVASGELAASIADAASSAVVEDATHQTHAQALSLVAAESPNRNSHESGESAGRTSPEKVIDGIRSTLASLVTDLDSGVHTVSAYILDRVENDFAPGVLPGLLVDARSSRVRRDSVEWIEV